MAIVIGAALVTKQLPVHKLIELCISVRYPIILLGGKEDIKNGEAIAKADDIKIYNACGKFSLNESADLVNNAKLVITHDTGLMHIAAALQKAIISIWGNTVPSFGMYPYYGKKSNQQYHTVQVNKLWCRPCSKIGYKKCPRGHFKCMEQIPVNEFVNIVHDEIIVECPDDIVEKCKKQLKDCMEKAGTYFCRRVPLHADPQIADRWVH